MEIGCDESKSTFLHGLLKVQIIKAVDLPDTDTSTAVSDIDRKVCTDPYVVGDLGAARLFKTRYVCNSLNPEWNEKFEVYVCHEESCLKFHVKNKRLIVGSDVIASTSISAKALVAGKKREDWFDLKYEDRPCGKICLSIKYIPKEYETSNEMYDSYFEPRKGCRMILYQAADTPQLPQFEGLYHPDGSPYVATRAWRDLYDCIKNAQKFIYITGWSFFTAINLLRGEDDPEGQSNVGELLKAKADEGVNVLLMIWNDKTYKGSYEGWLINCPENNINICSRHPFLNHGIFPVLIFDQRCIFLVVSVQ